jgi:adenine-specific DNA methylase
LSYDKKCGFMAIVDRINWQILDSLVEVQQRNRETHTPMISLYRWWARRPHAVAGAILDAARAEFGTTSFLVADPFSGGGTVAIEAICRGHAVYAQDLYPWPSLALGAALTRTDAKKFAEASEELLRRLDSCRHLYCRSEPEKTVEITHVIRVRVAACPNCAVPIYVFRDPLVSLLSRRANEKLAYFGCHACGELSVRKKTAEKFKCDSCGQYSALQKPKTNSAKPEVCCPHCKVDAELSFLLDGTPIWKPVLVKDRQFSAGTITSSLRQVMENDLVEDIAAKPEESALKLPIPIGVETRHLLRSGFRYWSDLYTHRQIQTLLTAIQQVETLDYPSSVKTRLRLAVLGACEMAGYLCRWDRTHPKTFEAIANHRYSRCTVVTETNLLSPIGRGTIPRRLDAALKGLQWLQERSGPFRTTIAPSTATRRRLNRGALVARGNSGRQLLQDGSAQLVLTDPPYHDDIQYGELARLFHVWLSLVAPIPSVAEQMEAVPNPIRGTNTARYEQIIKECLSESRRTLTSSGRLIMTFHNNKLEAWTALRNALVRSKFAIVGLATVRAENAADHSKRNKRAFLCDLVIECIPSPKRSNGEKIPLSVAGSNNTKQRRNLLAVGLALAETVNACVMEEIRELYQTHLGRMGESETVIN